MAPRPNDQPRLICTDARPSVRFCIAICVFAVSFFIPNGVDAQVADDAAITNATTTDAIVSPTAELVIETIRELNPTTPHDLLKAVETLLNVKQPMLAMEYLNKLIAQNRDDIELIRVYRDMGPAFFIRLTRAPGMGDEAGTFARRVLETARKSATDPARLRQLVEQLQDPKPELRAAAVAGIADAGSVAVGELLPVLDASRGTKEYEYLRAAMRTLGRDAHGPLLGALQSPDANIQAAAIRALADLRVHTSMIFLNRFAISGSSPDVSVAAQSALSELGGQRAGTKQSNAYMATVAGRLLRDGFPDRTKQMIKVWSWDTTTKAPTSTEMPPENAAAFFAAWLAADLNQIEPNNSEFERLYITAQLAAAKLIGGLDEDVRQSNPIVYARLAQMPVKQFEAVLTAELTQSDAAAIGAIEMLGHLGDAQILVGENNALALALKHGDPRVRFATVRTIAQLDPISPYPGAADFWQQLCRFARTEGVRRLLIVHSHEAQADNLAGIANGQGFRADAVGTHQAAMKIAIDNPDIEAILVSDAVELWTELLQQIRRDPRTSRIPVGLIARSESRDQAEQLARLDPLTVAYPLPYEPDTLAVVVQNTLNQASISRTGVATRMSHGEQAIGWVADIVSNHSTYSFYNIIEEESTLIGALLVPEFAPQAATALGAWGTPRAQQALIDLASQNSRPLELRQAASAAFHAATRRQGVQLTSQQVLAQYDRYNASESLDESTQQIMASVLDSIETAAERTSVFETVDTP